MKPLNSVLAAVDLGPSSKAVITQSARFALRNRAKLQIHHVVGPLIAHELSNFGLSEKKLLDAAVRSSREALQKLIQDAAVNHTEAQSSELRVSVFKLGKDFDYFRLGEIAWDGERILVEPAEDRDLQQIARKSYWVANTTGIKRLSPKDDPVAWISSLHKWYSTYLFRVGKVRSTGLIA